MTQKLFLIISLCSILLILTNCGKESIVESCTPLITNHSFEFDEPRESLTPTGWQNCGDTLNSPTDIFASNVTNAFGVSKIAEDGDQFIGMVVRPDGSKECVSQVLNQSMTAGTYRIFFSISKPEAYESFASVDSIYFETSFTDPVNLKIIGIDVEDEEVLLTSAINESVDWVEISKNVTIQNTIKEIKLTANFVGQEFYSGGILIDYFNIERI